jgi:3-mercaptopropionate dioxygenase
MASVTFSSASSLTGNLSGLAAGVRDVTRRPSDWAETADRAAAALARRLPTGAEVQAVLPGGPEPDHVRSQVLHVEPDGSFSIVALLLRPGQATVIHDHVTWCAVAVIDGLEREDLFALDETSHRLTPAGSSINRPGDVSGFAPPGDIHRVTNIGDGLSISINVYGTDIARIGSSVRRTYEQPAG